jgi:hypothetical protein
VIPDEIGKHADCGDIRAFGGFKKNFPVFFIPEKFIPVGMKTQGAGAVENRKSQMTWLSMEWIRRTLKKKENFCLVTTISDRQEQNIWIPGALLSREVFRCEERFFEREKTSLYCKSFPRYFQEMK